MELILQRTKLFPTHTIGQLYVDGEFFCFTLEDVVREKPGVPVEQWKIKHETAIPQGQYNILLVNSPHFGIDTPWLQNVPGFSEILIHSGNTAKDTSGCIIVGYRLSKEDLILPGTTRPARDDLRIKIKTALKNEEAVSIKINNI